MPSRVTQLSAVEGRTETPSDLLVEVHIYIVPQDKWIPYRRLAKNHVVDETVSAGFVRVLPDITLAELRSVLREQLPGEEMLQNYVFIKSIGRNFTQVKPHQESVVKVKAFLPPRAPDPEIHCLELSDALIRAAPSLGSLVLSETEFSESQLSSAFGRSPRLRGIDSGDSYRREEREGQRKEASSEEGPTSSKEGGGDSSSDGDGTLHKHLAVRPADRNGDSDDDSGSSEARTRGSERRDRTKGKTKSKKGSGSGGEKRRASGEDSEKGEESGGLEADDETSDPYSRRGSQHDQVASDIDNQDSNARAEDANLLSVPSLDAVLVDSDSKETAGRFSTNASPRLSRRNGRSVEERGQGGGVTGQEGGLVVSTLQTTGATPTAKRREGPSAREIFAQNRKMGNMATSLQSKRGDQLQRGRGRRAPAGVGGRPSLQRSKSEPGRGRETEARQRRGVGARPGGRAGKMTAPGVGVKAASEGDEKGASEDEDDKGEKDSQENEEATQYRGLSEQSDVAHTNSTKKINGHVRKSPNSVEGYTPEILDIEEERRRVAEQGIADGLELSYDIEFTNDDVIVTPRNGSGKRRSDGVVKDAWGSADNTRLQSEGSAGKKPRKLTRTAKKKSVPLTDDELRGEIGAVVEERKASEERRKTLFEQARQLHDTIVDMKEKRREQWWVRYTAARRQGTALEEQQASLRSELDQLHRKIIGSIVKRCPLVTGVRDEPSRKANLKISVIRLRHEIEDLKKRHESMDIKLETETKLKIQAEKEVKQLRQEVSQKKIDVALTRSKNPYYRRSLGDIPNNF